jgi:hypothetical protein
MIVLTSGLFDQLKIDFPSTLQTRQGPPQKVRFFYERLLTHSANFTRLEIAKPFSPATRFPRISLRSNGYRAFRKSLFLLVRAGHISS